MGASVGSKKGGARAEINITPLVDVVLVLLIIFMVISPGDATYVPDAIPKPAELDDSVVLSNEQLVLELRADGSALLNQKPMTRKEFESFFKQLLEQRSDRKLFIAVEDELPYGEVMNWMGAARSFGASTVALQIKEPSAAAAL